MCCKLHVLSHNVNDIYIGRLTLREPLHSLDIDIALIFEA